MAAKKFAISVPEDVMDQVGQAAADRGISRSTYIVQVLRQVAAARKDADITRRVNALFDDEEVMKEQRATARGFRQRASTKGTKGTEW